MDLLEEVFREQMVVCTDTGGVVCGLRQFDFGQRGSRDDHGGRHVDFSSRGRRKPELPTYREVTIPSGTTLRLDLKSAVSSDASQVEDTVRASLDRQSLLMGSRSCRRAPNSSER